MIIWAEEVSGKEFPSQERLNYLMVLHVHKERIYNKCCNKCNSDHPSNIFAKYKFHYHFISSNMNCSICLNVAMKHLSLPHNHVKENNNIVA